MTTSNPLEDFFKKIDIITDEYKEKHLQRCLKCGVHHRKEKSINGFCSEDCERGQND